jgi:hypothetical protein
VWREPVAPLPSPWGGTSPAHELMGRGQQQRSGRWIDVSGGLRRRGLLGGQQCRDDRLADEALWRIVAEAGRFAGKRLVVSTK